MEVPQVLELTITPLPVTMDDEEAPDAANMAFIDEDEDEDEDD